MRRWKKASARAVVRRVQAGTAIIAAASLDARRRERRPNACAQKRPRGNDRKQRRSPGSAPTQRRSGSAPGRFALGRCSMFPRRVRPRGATRSLEASGMPAGDRVQEVGRKPGCCNTIREPLASRTWTDGSSAASFLGTECRTPAPAAERGLTSRHRACGELGDGSREKLCGPPYTAPDESRMRSEWAWRSCESGN